MLIYARCVQTCTDRLAQTIHYAHTHAHKHRHTHTIHKLTSHAQKHKPKPRSHTSYKCTNAALKYTSTNVRTHASIPLTTYRSRHACTITQMRHWHTNLVDAPRQLSQLLHARTDHVHSTPGVR